ncbi:unnamed protein product [Rhizoctonia solani]|uniref:MIF4G domain-containing protein n=1 Tax=Rhizoctonia solani TaxID=456999 RepID=A0A8H3HNQ6_9AGAM|nr:unnamed protein product [Rhizoctonia solani]
MFYLNESLDQERFEEAGDESSPTSPDPPSVEEGPSRNNYGSHAPRAETGPGRPSSLPTRPTGAFEPSGFKILALLNALEAGDFDATSDEIIESVNRSEQEEDGRTLKRVTELIYKRTVDNPPVSEMYARLCRKMMEQISPNIQDKTIRNSEGQPITGAILFRKYLLNRCQEDFEHDRSTTESEVTPGVHKEAKRCNRRPVEFIGELFKLQMLTERIMHECIKVLISNVVNPEEEDIESLCTLLTTAGQNLDNPKARNHMDIYFERMREIAKGGNISSQMRLKLLDVIGLRARRWQAGIPLQWGVTGGIPQ